MDVWQKSVALPDNMEAGGDLYGLFRIGTDREEISLEGDLYSDYLRAIGDAERLVSRVFKLSATASPVQRWPSGTAFGQEVIFGWDDEWVACVRRVGAAEAR